MAGKSALFFPPSSHSLSLHICKVPLREQDAFSLILALGRVSAKGKESKEEERKKMGREQGSPKGRRGSQAAKQHSVSNADL